MRGFKKLKLLHWIQNACGQFKGKDVPRLRGDKPMKLHHAEFPELCSPLISP
jgi:hypothetical protein